MSPSVSAASLLAVFLLVIAVGYALACAVVPWGRCRKCRGTGHRLTRSRWLGRAWCRRCNGTGLRVRVGRRLWTWINREYRDGAR